MSDSDLNKTVTQIIRQMKRPVTVDNEVENVANSPVRKSLRIKMLHADEVPVCKTEKKSRMKRRAVKKSVCGKRKAEHVVVKRDIKMRRLGSDNLNKNDSTQNFDLLIAPNLRFVGKVGKACSFDLFVQSTKNKFWTLLQASKQATFYRLYGFPYAIQFWFYETLTTVPAFLCSLNNAAAYPRFMRWSLKDMRKIQNFDFKVFDDPNEKVISSSNIKATAYELSEILCLD
ncbi:uncharacterized protein LOC126676192 [Mercurialis annua]|uniref:uncharacterized protein LOC126676192 n=1 Tax=Mercurialis annua TaxID=3986 RepID=UPI00215F1DE7|nr:uncharacterized protein LOC126676192 [Mercurialis annua]